MRVGWLLSLSLVLFAGCIERAPSPRDRRDQFRRTGLGDVLLTSTPPAAKRVGAIFGDAVQLLGVDWSPQRPRPGDSVDVSFYYRVLDDVDEDYKVFVHVDDHGGRSDRINGDHWPADGRYPTGAWRRGEVIRDRWSFKVPSYYSGSALDMWTGFYQPGKDDRWPLTNRNEVQHDGQNRVLALTISVM
jgi:hypothetical protein